MINTNREKRTKAEQDPIRATPDWTGFFHEAFSKNIGVFSNDFRSLDRTPKNVPKKRFSSNFTTDLLDNKFIPNMKKKCVVVGKRVFFSIF